METLVEKKFQKKVNGIEANVAEVYEWRPLIGNYLDQVPADKTAREKWLQTRINVKITPEVRKSLAKWYGADKGAKVTHAEAFEICEYGSQPDAKEIKRLFPMLGK